MSNRIKRIIVWGCGYIGLSDMAYFAEAGIDCAGIDTNPAIKDLLIKREYKKDLLEWLDVDVLDNLNRGKIAFFQITDLPYIKEESLHIISVPSEKKGNPDMTVIFSTLEKICDYEKRSTNETLNIMIESTMVPGTAEKCYVLVQEHIPDKTINFCVAPRRDWFVCRHTDMRRLHRVYGTNSEQADRLFSGILSRVCDNLVKAIDYQHAEMSKSVENAFRHMDIALANQLSDAFPDMDIRHVLELAGTKWNIDTYFPSFGTGGYCIPLSSRYLLASAEKEIPLLQSTVEYDMKRPFLIADAILSKKHQRIGVLGMTYRKGIKVEKNCPVTTVIKCLTGSGVEVYIEDPMYAAEEILRLFPECRILDLNDKLAVDDLDALIIYTDHSEFYKINWTKMLEDRKRNLTVYDNTGLFEKLGLDLHENIEYHLTGKKRNDPEYIL